jgi:hypothetical protein
VTKHIVGNETMVCNAESKHKGNLTRVVSAMQEGFLKDFAEKVGEVSPISAAILHADIPKKAPGDR